MFTMTFILEPLLRSSLFPGEAKLPNLSLGDESSALDTVSAIGCGSRKSPRAASERLEPST